MSRRDPKAHAQALLASRARRLAEFAAYDAKVAAMPRWSSIDHSTLSPSGRASKASRRAMMERETARIFGPGGLPTPPQGARPGPLSEVIAHLRHMGTMSPKAGRFFAKVIAEIEAVTAQESTP